ASPPAGPGGSRAALPASTSASANTPTDITHTHRRRWFLSVALLIPTPARSASEGYFFPRWRFGLVDGSTAPAAAAPAAPPAAAWPEAVLHLLEPLFLLVREDLPKLAINLFL